MLSNENIYKRNVFIYFLLWQKFFACVEKKLIKYKQLVCYTDLIFVRVKQFFFNWYKKDSKFFN